MRDASAATMQRGKTALRRACALLTSVGLFATLTACSPPDRETEKASVPEGNLAELSPHEGFAKTLHEMAAILEEQPPSEATGRLRAYLEEHRATIEKIATELEQTALQLEGEERQAYIREAHPDVQKAMKRFAEAQLRFRDRANEAQKIELQEVLDALQ